MSGFGCDNIPYAVVVSCFLWNGFLLLGNVGLLLAACNYSRKEATLKTAIKVTCTFTYLFLVLTSIGCNSILTQYLVCPSQRANSLFYVISVLITILAIPSSLVLLQILFTFRFITSFEDSMLTVSKTLKFTLYLLCTIEIITTCLMPFCGIMAVIYYDAHGINNDNYQAYNFILATLFAILIVMYLIHLIILGINFCLKMKQFARINNAVDNNNDDNYNAIVNLTSKLFSCWLFAFVSTLCVNLLITILFLTNINDTNRHNRYIGTSLLSFSMVNLDSFVNGLALAMQFPFGSILYTKLCCNCDKNIKRCFHSSTLHVDSASQETSVAD